MPDFADEASELSEQHLEQALSKIVRYRGNSLSHCVECEDEIPDKRRAAIPGCIRCAECEELKEKGLL